MVAKTREVLVRYYVNHYAETYELQRVEGYVRKDGLFARLDGKPIGGRTFARLSWLHESPISAWEREVGVVEGYLESAKESVDRLKRRLAQAKKSLGAIPEEST